MDAPIVFTMMRHAPSPAASGMIERIVGYRETATGIFRQRETASLVVPLIISLGSPFSIALGREPGVEDRQPSFAAGLYAGPVNIESDGAAECIQVDFTPLGAYRFFGGAVGDLAARMVDIEDVLGRDGGRLRQLLGETTSWQRRFELVEDFVLRRATRQPSPEIIFAYSRLANTNGTMRVSGLAGEIGWSRRHFIRRFKNEIGVAPKTVARMMRFHRACSDACFAPNAGWAEIAIGAGYADQAHLVREFAELAGETPGVWARRMSLTDRRLLEERYGAGE